MIKKLIIAAFSAGFSLLFFCQDFDLIFKNLPDVGAYAKYKYKNSRENGKTAEGDWTVSVTNREKIDGEEYFLVEIYPFVFKTLTTKKGTLGIFLKKEANGDEKKNFMLRVKRVMFAEEGKEPYEIDESLLQMLKDDSRDFKVEKIEKERERKFVEFKDKIKMEVVVFDSEVTFEEYDGEKQNLAGIKEISPQVPFELVKEEYEIKKIGKNGQVKKTIKSVVELVDFSFTGAKSAFPQKKMKKKGFWGIIFS
ncbi:MAG: hypothetical protein N2445_03555 [Acidobacteria bacterium]|nr:hypothetical protein [Acidobacteriota bacterium]